MVKTLPESFEIIREEDPLKRIEMAGRTCYKSEEKMTSDSAKKFVRMILGRGHESVLEHAAVAVRTTDTIYREILRLEDRAFLNLTSDDAGPIISANIHAWRDMFRNTDYRNCAPLWIVLRLIQEQYPIFFGDLPILFPVSDILQTNNPRLYIIAPEAISRFTKKERMKHEYMTVRIICNRGVTHEWVRSRRQSSYSQESTRFCNYSRDKFDGQISVIDDSRYLEDPTISEDVIANAHKVCEKAYQDLIELGNKPQIARNVLPIGLKTEMVITYPLFQWHYFFKLRTPKVVHPQMREISLPLLEAAKKEKPGIFDDVVPEE